MGGSQGKTRKVPFIRLRRKELTKSFLREGFDGMERKGTKKNKTMKEICCLGEVEVQSEMIKDGSTYFGSLGDLGYQEKKPLTGSVLWRNTEIHRPVGKGEGVFKRESHAFKEDQNL